jgi:hypothetical protein
MGRLKSLSVAAIVALNAFSAEAQTQMRSEHRDRVDIRETGISLDAYLDKLASRPQRTYRTIKEWRSAAPEEAKSCGDLYESMFADGVMYLNLAFGYHDAGAFTMDGELYAQTFRALTRPCWTSASNVCGFRVISGSVNSHAAVLVRDVELTSRMLITRDVTIQVTLARGSDARLDEYNLNGDSPSEQQKRVTRLAEDVFFGGIAGVDGDGSGVDKCEVCGYYGHARSGGGPDFSPVPYSWRKSNGEPNYSYYKSRRPGYRRLLDSLLRRQGEPPKMVSLLACYTHKHFWTSRACVKNQPGCKPYSLSDFGSKTGFVLSMDYSWPENFSGTVGVMLDTVIGLKCRSAWEANNAQLKRLPGNPENYGMFGKFY